MNYVVSFKFKKEDKLPLCVTTRLYLCKYGEAFEHEYIYDYEKAVEVANKMKKLYPKGIVKVVHIGEK